MDDADTLSLFRKFLESELGPAKPLTDAQVGEILHYARNHLLVQCSPKRRSP
jgi:hypothetical protein